MDMRPEWYGRCIGCDDPFTEYDFEDDITEVVTQYGDGFAHDECMNEGMQVI